MHKPPLTPFRLQDTLPPLPPPPFPAGSELVSRLSSPEGGLSAFILMQKIQPPAQSSVLVRNGRWAAADTVSELGIYGTFLRRGEAVLLNNEVGWGRPCASVGRGGWLIPVVIRCCGD